MISYVYLEVFPLTNKNMNEKNQNIVFTNDSIKLFCFFVFFAKSFPLVGNNREMRKKNGENPKTAVSKHYLRECKVTFCILISGSLHIY